MQHYYPFFSGFKKHRYRGIIYALIATVSGAMAIITIKAFPNMPGIQITALWLSLGSLISLGLNYRHDRNRSVYKIITQKTRYLLLQTLISTISAFCLIQGISLLNAPTAAFINATVFILCSIVIGIIAFGDKLSLAQISFISGVIAGLGIISFENLVSNSVTGIFLIVLAAFFLALGGYVVKKFFKPEETFALNAIRSLIGGISLLLIVFLTQKVIWPSFGMWPIFISGLILGNVIQYSFLYKAYEWEKLEVVSSISALSPFIVLILAFFFLQNIPKPLEIVGGSLMVFSTLGLILANKNLTKWKINLS